MDKGKLRISSSTDAMTILYWLIRVRVASAAGILLFFSAVRASGLLVFPFFLFAASPLLEIFVNWPYLWLAGRTKRPRQVFFLSQIVDIVAITWGIYFIGGTDIIPASLVYPLVFIFSALLSTRTTWLMANLSFLAYAGMVCLDYYNVVPHVSSHNIEIPGRLWVVFLGLTWVLFNLIAFFCSRLVGMLRKVEDDLKERVKELGCFYELARIVDENPDSLDAIMAGMATKLPAAFLYPEIACARITLREKEFKTDNFAETPWKRSSDLKVFNEKAGVVEVGYLVKKPDADAGPFLKEEKMLLEAIAERLGRIAERVIHRRYVEQYSARLKETNKALGDFTHIISHDLQEPLRNIEAFTGFLMNDHAGKMDEEGQGYLSRVMMNSVRMRELIDGLLALSHAGGKMELARVNAGEFVKEAIRMCDFGIKFRQAEVIVQEDMPWVICNSSRTAMAVHNLICNAIKFTGSVKPRVEIGYKESGDFYEFHVKDNGRGIKKEDFDRIFELFVRLGSADDIKGAGIGLTIVKQTIEAQGGRVWLESEIGKGTTFYFTLPKQMT